MFRSFLCSSYINSFIYSVLFPFVSNVFCSNNYVFDCFSSFRLSFLPNYMHVLTIIFVFKKLKFWDVGYKWHTDFMDNLRFITSLFNDIFFYFYSASLFSNYISYVICTRRTKFKTKKLLLVIRFLIRYFCFLSFSDFNKYSKIFIIFGYSHIIRGRFAKI